MIKLWRGDCLELMNRIPDGSIDMVLCDLPYGMTTCKWDTIIPFKPLWKQYNRIVKPNGAIVLFGGEPFSSLLRTSNPSMYRYDWYWDKGRGTGHLSANRRPLMEIETVSVFYKSQPTYNPQMRPRDIPRTSTNKGSQRIYGTSKKDYVSKELKEKHPVNILHYSNAGLRSVGIHPTQKPVELLEYLIRTYTNKKETVLDNCMGSGSTGIACVNTDRSFIGIELDKEYFTAAKKRIQEAIRYEPKSCT